MQVGKLRDAIRDGGEAVRAEVHVDRIAVASADSAQGRRESDVSEDAIAQPRPEAPARKRPSDKEYLELAESLLGKDDFLGALQATEHMVSNPYPIPADYMDMDKIYGSMVRILAGEMKSFDPQILDNPAFAKEEFEVRRVQMLQSIMRELPRDIKEGGVVLESTYIPGKKEPGTDNINGRFVATVFSPPGDKLVMHCERGCWKLTMTIHKEAASPTVWLDMIRALASQPNSLASEAWQRVLTSMTK